MSFTDSELVMTETAADRLKAIASHDPTEARQLLDTLDVAFQSADLGPPLQVSGTETGTAYMVGTDRLRAILTFDPSGSSRIVIVDVGFRVGEDPEHEKGKIFTQENRATLRAQIDTLRQEHRDIDAAIAALSDAGQTADGLQVARLKRRKLMLRDKLSQLEDRLTPNIIV